MNNLSDSLNDIAQTNVYGLFMQPVGRYRIKDHQKYKTQILEYIQKLDGNELKNERPTISVNVVQ